MDMTTTTRKSRRQMMAEEGCINEQYTLDGYFVKVKPAFEITKIVFCFVMKGHKGAGFDIYMDIDRFDNWADDILNYKFERIMADEKASGAKYPKHYKYTTGNNGEKSVGFANASNGNGYVINGVTVIDGKKTIANVPVDMDWLRTTAKYFRRAAEQSHVFFDLTETMLAAVNNYHREIPSEEAAPALNAVEGANKDKKGATTECGKNESTIASRASQKPTEASSEKGKKADRTPVAENIEVFTSGALVESSDGGEYYVPARTKTDEDCFLVFDKKFVSLLGNSLNILIEKAKEVPVKITFTGSMTVSKTGKKTYYAEKLV